MFGSVAYSTLYARQQGMALIIVLMILAIVSGMSLSLATLTDDARRNAQGRFAQHALYYAAMRGEALAMASLSRAFEDNDNRAPTTLPDLLPMPENSHNTTEQVETDISLHDLQGRFNLTTLIETPERPVSASIQRVFTAYCNELSLPFNSCTSLQKTLNQIHDNTAPDGPEVFTLFYQVLNALIDTGEISLEHAAIVANEFTALPINAPINMNGASLPLLRALAPNLSRSTLRRFRQDRGQLTAAGDPMTSTDTVVSTLSGSGLPMSESSEFFAINTTVTQEGQTRTLQSVVFINHRTGNAQAVYRRTLEFPSATPDPDFL